MRLTFRGWLLSYCQELTGLKTTSVKKLAAAVEDNAPHASAAVFLLSVNEGKLDTLLSHASEPDLRKEWNYIASILPENQTDAETFAR